MKRFLPVLAALVLASPVRAAWNDPKVWDDGLAEVASYDAQRVIYGKSRSFVEHVIVVKEDLRADTLIKADDPGAQPTLRVFKLNQAQRLDTENYPYTFLTTVFAPAEAPRGVVKISVGSQEWCGNTFKLLTMAGKKARLAWHSYFDGEGDQTLDLEAKPEDLWDDALPLALRSLPLAAGYRLETRVWDSLTSSHGTRPRPVPAVISVTGSEDVSCRAGRIPAWKVTVVKGGATDTYWFEKADPRVLVRMETADGRRRILRGRTRWAYWDRSQPRPAALN